MVFRKPYAFFIKYFRRIHFVLILLCAFIYSRSLQVYTFNKEFLVYSSYDSYFDPISRHLSLFLYLALIITIISFLILLIVLKRKSKPWKLYLVPVISYIGLLIVFIYTTNFYIHYDGKFAITTVRALNNFVSIFTVPQYFVFILLIVRILGLDIKSFNFSADTEFLELDQDDREEFEVNIDFDKHALKRILKRAQRTLGYFYEEHKFICNIIFTIICVFALFKIYYYFGVTHKTVKENKVVNINNYAMRINKSFYTTRDKSGELIEKDSAFIIVNISVVNNGESRVFDGDDFHVVNGSSNYTFQGNTYSKVFSDLGNSYPTGKIKHGAQKDFALIFKVDRKLSYKKFVLYYQQYRGRTSYLRKIKLKLSDVSKIKNMSTKKLGEEFEIEDAMGEDTSFTFEDISFVPSTTYNTESCNQDGNCYITSKDVSVNDNYKIMLLEFSSIDYEGTDLIDFSRDYGKIKYVDKDGFIKSIKVVDAMSNKDYLGKYLYIKVPNNLENSEDIDLVYTVRNRRYIYNIK